MLDSRARALGRTRRACAPVELLLCLALSAACGGTAEDPAPATRDQSILRGSLAASPELDHTGALVAIDPDSGVPDMFCTATLIAPETVVTAKHCALSVFQAVSLGFGVAWLAGPSVFDATEIIDVVAVELAPGDTGGFLGIGRDVAVAHLERATDIPAVQPRALADDQLGESLISIGYGIFSPIGSSDQRRRSGSETLEAVRGRALEAIFGSFENYVEWSFTGTITSANFLAGLNPGDLFVALLLPSFRADYDSVLLLDGYEAVTGRTAGDSQTCSGDSGGPLARRTEEGGWETFGVVSGGLYSAQSVCDFGTVFATFGPDTLAFLQQAQAWSDPCGDVPAEGACQGSVAARCATRLLDDTRQLVSLDCAARSEECVLGTAGPECRAPAVPVDAPEPDPLDPGPADAGAEAGEPRAPEDGAEPAAGDAGP